MADTLTLALIGVLAGLVTGLSPCVLPVLPMIFAASGTPAASGALAAPSPQLPAASGALAAAGFAGWARRAGIRRSLIIVLGMVVSFAIFTLTGSLILTWLGLGQGFLRVAGLVVLAMVALGLLVPRLGELAQRPFARFPRVGRVRAAGPFVLGLGLGALFVPCAGPVLAAISLAGTTGHIDLRIVVLTAAFCVGAAIPLSLFALAGESIGRRLSAYRRRRNAFRIVSGVVMLSLVAALAFNLTNGLVRRVPAYTQALQDRIEANPAAQGLLADTGGLPTTPRTTPETADGPAAPLAAGSPVVPCQSGVAVLANCGQAPKFAGIVSWLNTAHALTLASLQGKVVLVDFWAFSCVNCQDTLPYLTSWYAKYHSSGLEIVGIHTPEFSFEKVESNVADAVRSDRIAYPVGLDSNGATWSSYHNSYWPAEYLIDATGTLRHEQFGEGGYATSETFIRQLLLAANPAVVLPPAD